MVCFFFPLIIITGLFAAAHDMNIEWVIVKGISHFSDDSNTPEESWKSFASIMAASLVSNMLNDPVVFKEWPHYEGMSHPWSCDWLLIGMNFLFRYFCVNCFSIILGSNFSLCFKLMIKSYSLNFIRFSFESFSPLGNVWINQPLMPSSDVITTWKHGVVILIQVDCLNIRIIMYNNEKF